MSTRLSRIVPIMHQLCPMSQNYGLNKITSRIKIDSIIIYNDIIFPLSIIQFEGNNRLYQSHKYLI